MDKELNFWQEKIIYLLIAVSILVWFSGAYIDVMDIDASQYAHMSRDMARTNNYLQVYELGKDYLDKPPMLFWLSSLSMKLFGENNFAYKLPSILAAIGTLCYTFLLAKKLTDKNTALVATLMLSVCQGMYLMTNDVRTDALLTFFVPASIFYWLLYVNEDKWKFLLYSFSFIACGMMTKGPIAFIVPAISIGSYLLLSGKWKQIFDWKYFVGIAWILLLLLPMCIGLYLQFDLHPEKIIYKLKGPSGLRFFFWTQSFGRITGEIYWNNGATFEFLFVNMLWSFLPWTGIFIQALYFKIKQIISWYKSPKPKSTPEVLSFFGFVFTYCMLGVSKYQLPHYIYIVFPLACIFCAQYAVSIWENFQNNDKRHYIVFRFFMFLFSTLILLACIAILYFVFPNALIFWMFFILIGVIFCVYVYKKSTYLSPLLLGASAMILFNFFLLHQFYFNLSKYRASSEIGKYIAANNINPDRVFLFNYESAFVAAHFYAGGKIKGHYILNKQNPFEYVITSQKNIRELNDTFAEKYVPIKSFKSFPISRLKLKFLNNKTREQTLDTVVLLRYAYPK